MECHSAMKKEQSAGTCHNAGEPQKHHVPDWPCDLLDPQNAGEVPVRSLGLRKSYGFLAPLLDACCCPTKKPEPIRWRMASPQTCLSAAR